jgi:hypothetical protein
MTRHEFRQLSEAQRKVSFASAKRAALCERVFVVGSDVDWSIAGRTHFGTVLYVSGTRLKVRNDKTRKERWITLHDVLSAVNS